MPLQYARSDDRWSYKGFRVITLETNRIRLDVVPELGGKIFRLIDKRSDVDLLWHNPRLDLVPVLPGLSYDDHFTGGWDELFPNDAAGRVGEEIYPDHGEIWSRPWSWEVEHQDDAVSIVQRVFAPAAAATVEKRITLPMESSQIRFTHHISNHGSKRLEFLFKIHPALAIEPGDVIDVPGEVGELVDPSFSTTREPRTFEWPVAQTADGPHDFSVIPEFNGTREFVYVRNLRAGWCALRRPRLKTGLALTFPKEMFSTVWLFMTFGGWRGLSTVVLEPCTASPKDLNVAIARGTVSRIEAGESISWDSSAVVLDDAAPLAQVHPDGRVERVG